MSNRLTKKYIIFYEKQFENIDIVDRNHSIYNKKNNDFIFK